MAGGATRVKLESEGNVYFGNNLLDRGSKLSALAKMFMCPTKYGFCWTVRNQEKVPLPTLIRLKYFKYSDEDHHKSYLVIVTI